MKKANNIEQLAPTFVEKPLVSAVANHRDEWPYIYLEMKKVTKEDLLLDAEYCARHKHPSMTNFYEECGKISGIHISMLRKIQRAGTYYESARQRHAELPKITNSGVCDLSPDTLTLVAKIVHLIGRGGAKTESQKDAIERLLLEGLVEGRGLSRKQLNAWYEYLDDSIYRDDLSSSVADFLNAMVVYGSSVEAKVGSIFVGGFRSWLRPTLLSGTWLGSISSKVGEGKGKIRVLDSLKVFKGNEAHVIDFAVLETVTATLASHAVICKKTLGRSGDIENAVKHELRACLGFDYVWLVFLQGDTNEVIGLAEDLGVGAMQLVEGELLVLRTPEFNNARTVERCTAQEAMLQRFTEESDSPATSTTYTITSF